MSSDRFSKSRLTRITAEGLWIILGQALSFGGALLGVRLLTQVLTPIEYGQLGLGVAAAGVINQILTGPLANGASRFYSLATANITIDAYYFAIRKIFLWVVSAILLLLTTTLLWLIIIDRQDLLGFALTSCAFALVSGYSSILIAIQIGARQHYAGSLHQGIEVWMRLGLAILFVDFIGPSGQTALWGYCAGTLLVCGYQFVRTRHLLNARPANLNPWVKPILNYSWPFAIWGIFSGVYLASDRWALDFFSLQSSVGIYIVLYQLGYTPTLVMMGLLTQFISPILYLRAGDGTSSHQSVGVKKITSMLVLGILFCTLIAVCISYFYSDLVLRLFTTSDYWAASYLLPWMVLSGGLFAAAQLLALNFMTSNNTRKMLPVKIVTAVIGIALNFVGAYLEGIAGIIYAQVIFSTIYFVWMMIISFALFNIELSK
jgi:O-antigen/teichoic acid export membrane protein